MFGWTMSAVLIYNMGRSVLTVTAVWLQRKGVQYEDKKSYIIGNVPCSRHGTAVCAGRYPADRENAPSYAYSGAVMRSYMRMAVWTYSGDNTSAFTQCRIRNACHVPDGDINGVRTRDIWGGRRSDVSCKVKMEMYICTLPCAYNGNDSRTRCLGSCQRGALWRCGAAVWLEDVCHRCSHDGDPGDHRTAYIYPCTYACTA